MLGQGVSPYLISNNAGVTLDSTLIESNQIYDGKSAVSSNGKKEAWTVYNVTGFFAINPNLSASVTVPYVSKANVDFDSTSNTNPGVVTAGLGDVSATGRYTLFDSKSPEGAWIGGVLFGIKLPTGSTDKNDQQGNPVDRHAQPGTGSYDLNLGFTSAFTGNGYQATFDAVYNYAGKGKWNGRNHRYGDSINATLKGYLKTSSEDIAHHAFYVFTGPSVEIIGKETGTQTDTGYDSNMINPSSGGTVGYWNFGFYGVLQNNTFVNVGLAKAIYHDMNFDSNFDADPAEDYKVNLSVSFLF
ncbi:MAG TPA: hypothetical protein VN132_05630 [Bdellovibrio sp.]|nr:hypothetical protein [Bdellovibrio sp.]